MVRLYKNQDKEQLCALVIESDLYQKQQLEKEGVDAPKLKELTTLHFERNLNNEDRQYIVAEHEGEIIGFILVEVSPVYVGQGFINDLFVLLDQRRRGWGKKLSHAALVWLKEKGIKTVSLSVHTSNAEAISLYKQHGFKEKPELYMSLEKEL